MKKFLWSVLAAVASVAAAQGAIPQGKHPEMNAMTLQKGLKVAELNGEYRFAESVPLFSVQLNGKTVTPLGSESSSEGTLIDGRIRAQVRPVENTEKGLKYEIVLTNVSRDTINVQNVVPFGETPDRPVYIKSAGRDWATKYHMYRAGYDSVSVLMPSEITFCVVPVGDSLNAFGFAKRFWSDGEKSRGTFFDLFLYPGGSAKYYFWADLFEGDWQEGLRIAFQDRMMYEVPEGTFDNTLFEREDLKWIRHAYAMHLIMAWDHYLYDYQTGKWNIFDKMDQWDKLYGGDEVIGIWPNWPMLGIDKRNQWDLFRDMPGGTPAIKKIAERMRGRGTKFFISYNPWDESTRWEDHHTGMSAMIGETSADGVVLDTEGKSSTEHQEAADMVRPGVIMYSEGMAEPRDMHTIVAGRLHDALYYTPVLNLNKLIKPEFAIFRVAQTNKGHLKRDFAVSMFNGHGTELNIFGPGRADYMDDEARFFGRTLMVLRQNTDNFTGRGFKPFIPTLADRIYVNEWTLPHKTVYTMISFVPEGYADPLFEAAKPDSAWHYVDIWNHEEAPVVERDGKYYVRARFDAFNKEYLGTNAEGASGAVARFPKLLEVSLDGDYLTFGAAKGDNVRVSPGDPAYEKADRIKRFSADRQTIKLLDQFGRHEGKFVVQLFDGEDLLDERIIYIKPGTPRLISLPEQTAAYTKAPKGMVKIPAGEFSMKTVTGDNFIPTPDQKGRRVLFEKGFYMDRFPVTNAEFKKFLDASGYKPAVPDNFLKHWVDGEIPEGQENYPVVYVSYEDAKAYAKWAGKRLPTEAEWQYAAQTPKMYEFPWGDKVKVERVNETITGTLTVSKLKMPEGYCNTGDGEPYPVGKYPKGANPYGLQDLVGCVWQMTHDLYDNCTDYIIVAKGGSYWLPAASWWYVQGGPRDLMHCEKILHVYEGFERSATVGFRCVADM